MRNERKTSELKEASKDLRKMLQRWEREVERSKKPLHEHVNDIGWKRTAAIFQYSASVKIARLGAELLDTTIDNRMEGLLFGLTKRPMFETYTRGIWLEHVADDKHAMEFLKRKDQDRDREWKTLGSVRMTPKLEKMWNEMEKKDLLKDTVAWMKSKKEWWNDSTHVNARSVLMGWSHEYGEVIQNDEEIRGDLSALVEIGGQCAGHIHTLTLGDAESAQERLILEEKRLLRVRIQV